MSFSRWWTEFVAALGDRVPLPLITLLLLLAAGGTAAAWYWFPGWLPRRPPRWKRLELRRPAWRWPRLRRPRPRWPWRRRKPATATLDDPALTGVADEELPDLPPAAFTSFADQLAAQGRYAESVRERLRAMVRELVDRRVIEHHPGWTVAELAGAAAQARPAVDGPLKAAGRVFSDLWYGQHPARSEHDARMREFADEMHRELTTRPAATGGERQ